MITVQTLTESAAGRGNQDFVIAQRHPLQPEVWVCAIADGQGGRPEGDKASKIACEVVLNEAQRTKITDLGSTAVWSEILGQADQEVSAQTEGFTTLIGFALGPEFLCGGSVGDSKLYFRDTDRQIRELTSRQAKNPPCGSSNAFFQGFSESNLKGNSLLAVTDGAWKFCSRENLVEAIESPISDQPVRSLLEVVRANFSGNLPDDFSAIVATVA